MRIYNLSMNYPIIIAACWAAFILYWAISAVGIKKDITRGSWWRSVWLRVIVLAAVVAWYGSTGSLGRLTSHLGFHEAGGIGEPVGALLSVLGIAYAIWARMHLGRNWSPGPALKEGHELVTSGPYALVRHPIYTGLIIAMTGSVLVSPTWAIMLVIMTAVFVWRVHKEEGLMQGQFPDQYPEYKKHTWALIPYLW
jgi:protein-S-isoprenylcysteine O-methyltransferase Ste14